MDVARWGVVRRVFEEALDQPEDTRESFVRAATRGDTTLRAEVERLLALHADERRGSSPGPPAADELLAALARGAPLAEGATLGTWRLLRRLGAGGMGEVWEAEQQRPHRRAALKVMRAGRAGPRALQRFRDEIDALARLEHPGIARILEAGEREDGGLWYAMELVPGARPLTEWARERRLAWREAVEVLSRVCDAVEHGHRNGVIHRDLKAGNILVGSDGQPRVIDFGVARLTGEGLVAQTQAGELVGTLATMAPEQLDGRADVRSDVYALGGLLHELLAGRPPYLVEDVGLVEAARRVRDAVPPPPSAARPELPRELDWVVGKALEKDPERRYAGAAALAEDLRRVVAHEPVTAGEPGRLYRARKFVRRHRVGVGFAAVVVLLLVGGIAGTTSGLLAALDARHDAEARQHDAEEARGLEAAARKQAEDSAAESEAVTQFLVDVFGSADPEAGGKDTKVVDALDGAEAKISTFLKDHPRAEVQLRGSLGLLDFNLGRLDAAETQLVRALEVDAQSGDTSPEAVQRRSDIRGNLAVARVDLGKLDEAEADLQIELADRRARHGPDDPRTGTLLNSLALLRHRQGRLKEAEDDYRQALDVVQRGAARGDSGGKSADELTVDAARIAGNLGGLLLDQLRLAEAEPLLVSALDTLRAQLGADHPMALTALNNLAGLRARQQRFDEAADLMQEAATMRAARLPPDHPALLATRANVATLRYYEHKYDEAIAQLEDVLAIRLAHEPAWQPELLVMQANLGSFVHDRGDGADGVRAIVERLLATGAGAQATSVLSATPLENFARYLDEWGMYAEALALLDEARLVRERLQAADDPGGLLPRAFRAKILALLQRPDDAALELEAVEGLMSDPPAADARRAQMHHQLALGWLAAGELPRAEPHLHAELDLLQDGGRPDQLAAALGALADVCDATGRPEEAAQWRERIAALSSGEAPR
ncbi:MAG TPA: serine/threonine-protein kinase [Planctomycetota bacterium]|nr:serine/threonine-protein kinase [Planctomycetota bacterium]